MRRALSLLALLAAWPHAALAQPADLPIAPATTASYPTGVRVKQMPGRAVYTSKAGLTLYGLDMRTVLRAGPDPALYCTGPCAEQWEPLLAPAGSAPNIKFPAGFRSPPLPPGFVQPQAAPDWSVIRGAQGPQWVYKGWHLVFVRRGDKPGSTAFDGAERLSWNTLKFIPPVPKLIAPGGVQAVWFEGAYALADAKGRLLFSGKCAEACAQWEPFAGGMASTGLGQWKVGTAGDLPQWSYRAAPVYVAPDAESVPAGGKVLRP